MLLFTVNSVQWGRELNRGIQKEGEGEGGSFVLASRLDAFLFKIYRINKEALTLARLVR